MHPEIGLKCCSGPIFFKTPPTFKNQELNQVVMAKNVIFTKSQKCKQKFLKIQNFFLRFIASLWAIFHVIKVAITFRQAP